MLKDAVQFAEFKADLGSGRLWRNGEPVPIQDLPFRLLAALLERPGELVTRAELTARLWGSDTFVDPVAGLNTAVAKLREALDDRADGPRFVETVPKRGYRFIGTIGAADPGTPKAGVERDSDAPRAMSRGSSARAGRVLAALAVLAVLGLAAYRTLSDRPRVRVAVVLFDNETGRSEMSRLAQGLTDATVTELTAESRLAVIGNAAALRTERPFRDIAKVRDELNADYIVIGQVQSRDDATIVRAHLIRAGDQAHVWVDVAELTGAGEARLQADVAGRIRAALVAHALASRQWPRPSSAR